TSFVCTLTILPLTRPASEFQLTRSPVLNLLLMRTSCGGMPDRARTRLEGGQFLLSMFRRQSNAVPAVELESGRTVERLPRIRGNARGFPKRTRAEGEFS